MEYEKLGKYDNKCKIMENENTLLRQQVLQAYILNT